MATKLFKDGDRMGIWTDAKDDRDFIAEMSKLWANLIEKGWNIADTKNNMSCDWEFQFDIWLPQVVEIVNKYRGYKSNVIESKVLYVGNILPKDFIAEVDHQGFLFRKEVDAEYYSKYVNEQDIKQ